jgi:GTP-binding protein
VIFDFAPQIEIGAEILNPRGEDERLAKERPAAQRRREKDRVYHESKEQNQAADGGPSTGTDHTESSSGHIESGSGYDDA